MKFLPMILKCLSIPELNFSESWRIGWNKINLLSKIDKYMTLFWFLGPLIYLIERDPADLWLTSICLIFIIRCVKRNDWAWTSQLWFKSAIALWIFGLFCAIMGPDPLFTLKEGFIWIRFPLFVAASQIWLAKDRDIRVIMLLSMLIGMLIMSTIIITEVLTQPQSGMRLTWPYGDNMTGGYIAKVSLPLFCVLIATAASYKSKAGMFSGLFGLLSLVVLALTGERTNFILRACSGILSSVIWKPKYVFFVVLITMKVIVVFSVTISRPDLKEHFTSSFMKSIPITNMSDTNGHWGAWRGGIQQGIATPIMGVGPSGTRYSCKNLNTNFPNWLPGKNYCGNHPHNFYIQLFAEVGIIGLLIGCLMFSSIFFSCYKARQENFNCPMAATAFVIPLALFFPLQQFGSFYSQWGNLFIWFAVAFAISQNQGWRKIKNNLEK